MKTKITWESLRKILMGAQIVMALEELRRVVRKEADKADIFSLVLLCASLAMNVVMDLMGDDEEDDEDPEPDGEENSREETA